MNDTERKQSPKLSVIICTYNRSELLADCIDAVNQQLPDVNGELIVVNDGSSDDSQAVIERAEPSVIGGGWVENRGLNAARNEGLRLASAPVVLYFDDDQIPPEGYLRAVIDAMKPGLDGVGGPVRDMGNGPRTCVSCSALGDVTLGDERRTSHLLLGGNMALRIEAFDKIGTFDERLSGRGDETEWFARTADLRFLYDPALWVWHRRDTFAILDLCRHGYRQGKATPVYESIVSARGGRRGTRAARYLGHALRRRCSHGLELLCREVGAIVASSRFRGG